MRRQLETRTDSAIVGHCKELYKQERKALESTAVDAVRRHAEGVDLPPTGGINPTKWQVENHGLEGKILLKGYKHGPSYFGDDEDSNLELGEYARLFRQICKMDCQPTVRVLANPARKATKDNLVPRGGDAFLNEVDGNLTLRTDDQVITTRHWQSKFRGPNNGSRRQGPTLDAISRQFGTSARELDDDFTEQFGLSITAFITNRFLMAALDKRKRRVP